MPTTEYKLSKRQITKIKNYYHDHKVLKRALANSLTQKRKSAKARALAKGNSKVVQRSILDLLSLLPPAVREHIRKVICDDFDFCNRKRDFQFLLSAIPVLVAATAGTGGANIPICLWVVILMHKNKEFLCDCEDQVFSKAIQKAIDKYLSK